MTAKTIAALLVPETHWRALHIVASDAQTKFGGLHQAAGAVKPRLWSHTFRRIVALDNASTVCRRITEHSIGHLFVVLNADLGRHDTVERACAMNVRTHITVASNAHLVILVPQPARFASGG